MLNFLQEIGPNNARHHRVRRATPRNSFTNRATLHSRADGEFNNLLDPLLRIYDADGNIVAEDDNSNGNGNASIKFRPPRDEPGIYFVEVTSVETNGIGGMGEYVLAIRGAELAVPIAPLGDDAPVNADLAAAVLAGEDAEASDVWITDWPSADTSDGDSESDGLSDAKAVDALMANLSATSDDSPYASDFEKYDGDQSSDTGFADLAELGEDGGV